MGLQSEARVDGDKVWLAVKYTTTVGQGESPDTAYERAEKTVQDLFTNHTMVSVDTITNLGD